MDYERRRNTFPQHGKRIESRSVTSELLAYGPSTMRFSLLIIVMMMMSAVLGRPADDPEVIQQVPPGKFEAFYPRESHGVPNGSSRPSHGHGSFYKHRNPALVDVKNPAAYGYRFDGERRFNFD